MCHSKKHADFPNSVDHSWTLSLRLRLKGTGSLRADGQVWEHKINDDSVGLPVTFASLKECRKRMCRHRQTPPCTLLRWAGSCPPSRGWTHQESWAHSFQVLLYGFVQFLHGRLASGYKCHLSVTMQCAISGALSKRWEYAPSSSVARLRRGKLDKDWCSIYFGDCSPSVLRKPYIPPPWEEAQSQPLGEMWPRSTCCLNHPSSVRRWRSMRSLQRAADLALRSGQFTPLRTVG